MSDAKKTLLQNRRNTGLCLQCGDDAEGKARCAECAEKAKASRKRSTEKRKQAGVCTACPAPAKPGCTLCEKCIESRSKVSSARYYKNKAAGVCRYCGAETNGRSRCEGCKAYNKEQQRSRYLASQTNSCCYFCGKPSIPGKVYCAGCREVALARQRCRYQKRRKQVFDHYGWKCACCNEPTPEFLEIDHIDGKGNVHRKKIGQSQTYKWLIDNDFPEGFQTLCSNCNKAKHTYGQCPHQRNKPEPLQGA